MDFNWSLVKAPPADDEIELTVIGPGFGECLVVHVGFGRWLIVDSCRDPTSKEPAALLYLKALGIDPKSHVDWVVATHWHEDHIGGLAKITQECAGARFCCAGSLGTREFFRYAARSQSVAQADNAGEFRSILEEMSTSQRQINWIQGHRTIAVDASPGPQWKYRIEALSPSDKEHSLFLDRIAAQLPGAKGRPHRALIAEDPNLAAVVLVIQWEDGAVLLGADLVSDSDVNRGWNAAVDQGLTIGVRKANLVKIPHHGSAGAHSDRMWNELLEPKPMSAITPYCRGRKDGRPPKKTDLKRIASLSSKSILTAPTQSGRARKSSSAIQLGLAQNGIVMRSLQTNIGIARFRRRIGANWSAEKFGRAKEV